MPLVSLDGRIPDKVYFLLFFLTFVVFSLLKGASIS